MTKTIYNEGRVVGESAYEEYVRQLKSVDPEFDVCTEREWLSAALGMGTSLILKVPKGAGSKVSSSSDLYMYQVELPYGSHLGAGSSVSGSYFYGECEFDERGWATVVTDYGPLISNTSSSSPSNDATTVTTSTVPVGDPSSELELPDTTDVSDITYTTEQLRLHEYTKVADGIVIQPGTWAKTDSGSPYKDFEPDLSLNPVVRLLFYEKITNPFYLLLTGFTNRSILRGSSKFDFGSVDTENPEDGDFIGCECYPWVAKIQFVSPPVVDYLNAQNIIRGSRNLKIETFQDNPLIKITSNNLLDTTVYTRESDASTSNASSANSFGTKITTWTGNTDASSWYSGTGTANIASKCTDSDVDESGSETIECSKYNVPGFTVSNNYQNYDKNTIKNGVHGGWYDIKIDPYKMIQDLIDEIYARFAYFQKRIDELEKDLETEHNKRIIGDKYVMSQIGGSSMSELVSLLNSVLSLIYNNGSTISIKTTSTEVDTDNYDETDVTAKAYSYTLNNAPSSSDGTIPRATLNIYSGNASGSSATNWIRSRSDNSENDLYAK